MLALNQRNPTAGFCERLRERCGSLAGSDDGDIEFLHECSPRAYLGLLWLHNSLRPLQSSSFDCLFGGIFSCGSFCSGFLPVGGTAISGSTFSGTGFTALGSVCGGMMIAPELTGSLGSVGCAAIATGTINMTAAITPCKTNDATAFRYFRRAFSKASKPFLFLCAISCERIFSISLFDSPSRQLFTSAMVRVW